MPSKAKKLNSYRKKHRRGYDIARRVKRIKASAELSMNQQQLLIAEYLNKGLGKKYPRATTLDPFFEEDAKCQSLLNKVTTIEIKNG